MRFTIIGNYGSGNLGDEAILLGVKTLITNKYPKAEIIVMGKGNLLPLGLRSIIKSFFIWEMWQKPLEMMKNADKIIIGGGGLFSDEESLTGTLLWSLHGIVAHYFLKKKLLCLGVSVGPMRFLSKLFAKTFFRSCSAIVVRDQESAKRLRDWGIHAEVAPDLALAIPENRIDNLENSHYQNINKYVVINLRSFKNFDEKMINIFVQFVDYIIKNFAFNIVLMPLKSGCKSDHAILNKIIERSSPAAARRISAYSGIIPEIVKLIADAEVIITMRLHGGILALHTETPCIPISYMEKVHTFWKSISPMEILSVNTLTLELLIHAFGAHLQNPKAHRAERSALKKQFAQKFEKAVSPHL